MDEHLEALCSGQSLDLETTESIFQKVVRGELSQSELSGLLIALKAKGETPEEIAGAARALRQAAMPFDTRGIDVVDTCGTGGDGACTVNISTAAGLLAAELGIHVAKHGNRSVSSACGSADLLESCGVKIDASPALSAQCLETLKICFLFAPQYHTGMAHAMPVRRSLGVRTLFNILGPLANPARPRWQLVGVYDPGLCSPVARTLGLLGCHAALVVHGAGLDEIALHAPTQASLWREGAVKTMEIDLEQIGLPKVPLEELRGGGPEENASWLRALLSGRGKESHNAAVSVNAGALLWITGRAESLRQGTAMALDKLSAGQTIRRLEQWAELSHGA